MKFTYCNLLAIIFFSCASEQNKMQDKALANPDIDSVNVMVKKDVLNNHVLAYEDIFDELNDLTEGRNSIPESGLISTSHWRSQDILIRNYDEIIEIEADSTRPKLIVARTKNEKINKELNFDYSYRCQSDSENDNTFLNAFFLDSTYLNNYALREEKIDKKFKQKEDYLKVYCKQFNLDKSFLNDWMNIIKYDKLYRRTYFGNYEKWDRKYLEELSKSVSELNQHRLLDMPYYRKSCWGIVNLLYYLKYGKESIELKKMFAVIDQNFKADTKDYLQFKLLFWVDKQTTRIRFSKKEYDSLTNVFYATSKTSEYNNYLRKSLSLKKIRFNSDELISTGQRVKSLAKILNNQLTYIDFWASWCVPCRQEMPDSKKLAIDYKNMGINFIYISMDDNPVAWQKAIKQIGLSENQNYLMPEGSNSEMAKKLKIITIPRYMIMDKEGKIINSDAPRPSDPKIREIFDGLLKK
ncbi:TlpA disulfide reductase family protein [Emticicia sp. 21SJ11W-3]|uniref:TlpA family protein disulfide reductase n=1 Tax=Emticicia sp. 21SJ11W-3 TaxID=2916755 RepID=UPI00209C7CDF|nr:TlpA disulfide reductase family protein [Emticicia sp. 21SJ11W-3]UTA67907.1 TlpA family protein disulfide reductase [Emticicia sp. 21SJ11W-3]